MKWDAWFVLSFCISLAVFILGVLVKVLEDYDAACTLVGLVLTVALAACTGQGVYVCLTKELALLREAVENQTLDELPNFRFGETALLAQLLVQRHETTNAIKRSRSVPQITPKREEQLEFPNEPHEPPTPTTPAAHDGAPPSWHNGWCSLM